MGCWQGLQKPLGHLATELGEPGAEPGGQYDRRVYAVPFGSRSAERRARSRRSRFLRADVAHRRDPEAVLGELPQPGAARNPRPAADRATQAYSSPAGRVNDVIIELQSSAASSVATPSSASNARTRRERSR